MKRTSTLLRHTEILFIQIMDDTLTGVLKMIRSVICNGGSWSASLDCGTEPPRRRLVRGLFGASRRNYAGSDNGA